MNIKRIAKGTVGGAAGVLTGLLSGASMGAAAGIQFGIPLGITVGIFSLLKGGGLTGFLGAVIQTTFMLAVGLGLLAALLVGALGLYSGTGWGGNEDQR